MAFRASNQVQSDGYTEAKRLANDLKSYCQDVKAATEAGPISGNLAIALHERLISDRARFLAIAAIPGISAYAQSQENDNTYNAATEFTAMTNAIAAVRDWLIANVSTTGWVTFATSGVSTKTFSTAATAGLRTQLNSLIAAIS